MLKIAHIRKESNSSEVKELAELFKSDDLRRQEKKVEAMRKMMAINNKKVAQR